MYFKKPINSFVYGMGSFFNIFNAEHKKCLNEVIKNKIKIHSSIYYPGSAFFFRNVVPENVRNNVNLIIKVSGYNYDQFRYELDQSLNSFKTKKFYGIQFWDELPLLKENNIDYSELEKILNHVDELKKNHIIQKLFLQINNKKMRLKKDKIFNSFDGFAFNAYPNEAQIDEENFRYISKNNKIFLQLQFFGGRYKSNFRKNYLEKDSSKIKQENWINKCIEYSINTFGENSFFVGSTRNLNRLKLTLELLNNDPKKKNQGTRFLKDCYLIAPRDYSIETHKDDLAKLTGSFYLIKQYLARLIKKILFLR